jgi:hypothetical protein
LSKSEISIEEWRGSFWLDFDSMYLPSILLRLYDLTRTAKQTPLSSGGSDVVTAFNPNMADSASAINPDLHTRR